MQDQFQHYTKESKNDNALATYEVEQVKYIASKRGAPWNFVKDTKEQQAEKKDAYLREGKNKENECAWPELQLAETEWGYRMPFGTVEFDEEIRESQVAPGRKEIEAMSWPTFKEK